MYNNTKNIKNNNVNFLYLNIKNIHSYSKYKFPIIYENALLSKSKVLIENNNKSGVYIWVNKINNESYVGSSINITNRLRSYYNINYLKGKTVLYNSRIYGALLKYNYCNFKLKILEYCNKEYLKVREQHYIDLLKPEYNICKTAGSMLGFKHSLKTLEKFKNRYCAGHTTIVLNKENNNIKKYNSVRAAAKGLGISHTNLLHHIKNNSTVKNLYLVYKYKLKD